MKTDDQGSLNEHSVSETNISEAETDSAFGRLLKEAARSPEYSVEEAIPSQTRTGRQAGAAAASEDWPRIEGFELQSELGRGGMGTVYKARQQSTGRLVAVKVVLGQRIAGPEQARRFDREIRILGRLQHPRIADIYGAGTTEEGDPYFVMELVDGQTLDRFLAAGPALRARLELFRKICDAVSHSHRFGVIHRDLKPQNVLVCTGGSEVKVLDFGLARLTAPEVDAPETITRQGAIQGTLPYMSPEQINGETLTTLSDVYTLGVMLYEVVAGRRPYEVSPQNLWNAMRLIREERPKAPSLFAPRHARSRDLDAIVLKALEKDPARRYQSVADLEEDLERYLENRPVQPRRMRSRFARGWYRFGLFCRRNLAPVAVGSLASVLLVALAVWSFVNLEAQRRVADQSAVEAREKTAESTNRLAKLYEEQGRQDIRSGHLQRAAVYLSEAYRLGSERTPLRVLLGVAVRSLDLAVLKLEQTGLGTPSPAAFSPDGSRLLTIENGGPARIWDLRTGRLATELGGGAAEIESAAFSPDGAVIASVGREDGVQLWDPRTGQLLRTLERAQGLWMSLAFSPDGLRIVAYGLSATTVWNEASGKLLASHRHHSHADEPPAFAPGGVRILKLGNGLAQVFDVDTGEIVASLEREAYKTNSLSPDGGCLLMAGTQGTTLRDLASGKDLVHFADESGHRSALLSPDSARVLTIDVYDHATLWDAKTGRLLVKMEGSERSPQKACFSADGERIALGHLDGSVQIFESTSGKVLATLEGHAGAVWQVVFSPDGGWCSRAVEPAGGVL